MLSFLKKKSKKSPQPEMEEIASTIKVIVPNPQSEESFIDRTPYKVISEVVDPSKPPDKIYKVPSYKEYPMVTFLTNESINSPHLISIGKSKITGYEIYRYTGDNPKIIHDICFQFGCAYEEIYSNLKNQYNIYTDSKNYF
jgi:hypothetical protein